MAQRMTEVVAVIGVTGGAGFIGGALLPYLAARGHTVRALDNFSGPISVEHPSLPVERLDVRDEGAARWLAESDVVLHLAAVSGVMACAADPVASRAVNVAATRRIAEACRASGTPCAFASSFAVVGVPDRLPITEETPARPTHAYAQQKAEGEEILRKLAGPPRFPVGILRMSNVYGRYRLGARPIAKRNVLNLFAEQAIGGTLRVNAPGTQRRDFIHILDVVAHWESAARFLLSAREAPQAFTFNVASGETATVLELADRVATEFRRLFPDRPAPKIEVVANPRGDIEILHPEFAVDRRVTEQRLGLACAHHLQDSIGEILRETAADLDGPVGRNA